MIRASLCVVALTIAFTAGNAEAGKFKFNFGGGHKGGWNHNHHNHHKNHHHHNHRHNYHHNHYVKKYHAPVAKCHYQVCFTCDAWGYKKHEVFDCLHDAQAFAHKLKHLGYYATISKTCTPYPSGHIIYNHGQYNHWMP